MLIWKEIYRGMCYSEFIGIENVLEKNNILIRTKVRSIRNRFAQNSVTQAGAFSADSMGLNSFNEEYRILVRSKDYKNAMELLSQN